MADEAARIHCLRKYISLLRQAEKCFVWESQSPLRTDIQRMEAEAGLRTLTAKMHTAVKELTDLEVKGRR